MGSYVITSCRVLLTHLPPPPPPSAAYMHQLSRSELVHIMACRPLGTKPLPEPMPAYCQLDSWKYISVKYELKFHHFHSRKCNWKCCLPKWQLKYLTLSKQIWLPTWLYGNSSISALNSLNIGHKCQNVWIKLNPVVITVNMTSPLQMGPVSLGRMEWTG